MAMTTEVERRPSGKGTATRSSLRADFSIPETRRESATVGAPIGIPADVLVVLDERPDYAVRVVVRAVQEALAAAMPTYWAARAKTFQAVGTDWADGAARACAGHALLLESERLGTTVGDILASITNPIARVALEVGAA